jgi:hypothetical protein
MVGSGMIACRREATSWRSRRQAAERVRRPGPGPRPSVESPRVHRRAARAEGSSRDGPAHRAWRNVRTRPTRAPAAWLAVCRGTTGGGWLRGEGGGGACCGFPAGLPGPGQELGDAVGRMVREPGEDIGEPGVGIDVVELEGLDQRIDGCGALAPFVRRDAMMPGIWAGRLSSPIRFIRFLGSPPSSSPIRFMAALGI